MMMNAGYQMRLSKFEDAVALRNASRVLFIPFSMHFFPARWSGVSNGAVMNDHALRLECLRNAVLHYDFDMAPADALYWGSFPWNVTRSRQWQKPGTELPDDRTLQFVEREVLSATEYDAFLNDPGDTTLRVIWPRIAGIFEPLAQLPSLSSFLAYPMYLAPFLAKPEFLEMLEALRELGEQWTEYDRLNQEHAVLLADAGYPPVRGGVCFAPFDTLSVFLRGFAGSMVDILRQPDKLLAAVEFLTDREIEMARDQVRVSEVPRVAVFAYRGVSTFLSRQQFERFYWPSLRRLLLALVDEGITPLPFLEGDFTSRLEYIAELPSKKIPFHFEQVDRKKARDVIGDRNSFWGNISASLLSLGTPEEVKADVRELLDTFGETNGLILDGGAAIHDDAKPECVEAVLEALETYR
jgi:hypothetical protein